MSGLLASARRAWPQLAAMLLMLFIDWLISPEGQGAIAAYKINGEQLFFPNAKQEGA